jgi:spore maturation protein CgeB
MRLSTYEKVTQEQHEQLIRGARFAPALQGAWQVDHGYIPCRLFKNISYSQLGVSNNPSALDLFAPDEIVFAPRLPELVEGMLRAEHDGSWLEMGRRALERVRDNHTYVNRIAELLGYWLETRRS